MSYDKKVWDTALNKDFADLDSEGFFEQMDQFAFPQGKPDKQSITASNKPVISSGSELTSKVGCNVVLDATDEKAVLAEVQKTLQEMSPEALAHLASSFGISITSTKKNESKKNKTSRNSHPD